MNYVVGRKRGEEDFKHSCIIYIIGCLFRFETLGGWRKFDLSTKDSDCHTKRLFHKNHVNMNMVLDETVKYCSNTKVDDFCRLYILLGLIEFFSLY